MKKNIFKMIRVCTMGIVLMMLLGGCTKKVENELVSFKIDKETYDGKFTGVLEDKLPEGKGSVIVKEGKKEWTYKGEFKKGKITGKGKFTDYPYELEYQGEEMNGNYSGEVKMGLPDGNGKFISDEKKIELEYDGEWKKGKLKGEGELEYNCFLVTYADTEYEGLFKGKTKDGRAEGEGSFEADSDSKFEYVGNWSNNLFHGNGVIKWEDDKGKERKYDGTYKEGEFTPTNLEVYKVIGQVEPKFVVSEDTEKFIKEHKELFTTKNYDKIKKYVDESVTIKKIKKTASKYDNKIMKLNNYEILQIFEEEIFKDKTLTTILATDSNYNDYCYIYYIGELKNKYEGSRITCYGVPAEYSSFENVSGGTTLCCVVLASLIK